MAKLQTYIPQVEQPPDGQFAITILDSEAGHGEQRFTASSLDKLCEKLAVAQQSGTQHIRELSRELDTVRADYSITRDVCNMLTALLMVKHVSGDEPAKALDKMIRSLTKELQSRLPSDAATNT